MASCITSQWVSTAPQAKLTVTVSSNTDTTATLYWVLQYVASYPASASSRPWSVQINGSTVDSGSYNIDGVTGTKTVDSGHVTINKTTSAQSISFGVSFAFNVTWSGVYGGTKTASNSISVAAKTSYAVTYDANGGTGAPSAQTKWYGTALTLSSTTPTRTGYTFKGWATSASGSVAYAAGASYTANAKVTLYAVWQAITYAVTYNANGGTGAPANQTKTYGTTLTLSSTTPTRTNYNFLGWGTTASATTPSYMPGNSYTANAAITLYAIWELAYTVPTITDFTVSRCTSSGAADDYGSYAKVVFAWETCQLLGTNNVSSIKIEWKSETASSYSNSTTVSASGTSGTVSKVIGAGALSTDNAYDVRVTVTDSKGGSNNPVQIVPKAAFMIDFLNGGRGVAFGKPAETEGVAEFEYDVQMNGTLDVDGKATFNGNSEFNGSAEFKTAYGGGLDSIVNITTFNEVGGGRAIYTTSDGTGILKIVLPQDFGKQMICFDVEIFSYTSQSIVTYSFAGQLAKNDSTGVYNWSSRAYNVQGNTLSTSSNLANLPINFGRHSSKAAVSIGTSTTSWGHCCVTVRNLKVWYSQQQPTYWEDGWQIVLNTSALAEIKYTDSDPMGMQLKAMGGMKKLWQNASPSSTFGAQNVTISGLYDALIIVPRYSNSYANIGPATIVNTTSSNVDGILTVPWGTMACREFTVTRENDNMTIAFKISTYWQGTSQGSGATTLYSIPVAIYGIKGVQ